MSGTVFNNLGLKISAVLIAVFLWFFVTSQGLSETTIEAPVEFKDVPAELGIVSSSARSVTLTLRGQERFMKNLNAADIRVFVNMKRATQGEEMYPVSKDDVKLPFTMTVTNTSPTFIKVRLEEVVSKSVRVQPLLTGTPEQGTITSVTADPKVVVIRGLRSEVKKVSMLRTEPFDVTGIRATVDEDVDLDISGTNVRPEVSKVRLKITLAEKKR